MPFILEDTQWNIPYPEYRNLEDPRTVLATDVLGSSLAAGADPATPSVYNHALTPTGPEGMNMLRADGSVNWNNAAGGWVAYGDAISWGPYFYAQ